MIHRRHIKDLVGFGCCISAGLLVLWWIAPGPRDRADATPPSVLFTGTTQVSGIDFLHRNGAYGDKWLPETMGGGVAFFDCDNDGAADLLFVNSTDWPWHPLPEREGSRTLALYRNQGNGTFTNTTAGSGLDFPIYGMGAACGDFDNDGWTDLFITAVGGNRLLKNLGGGRFADWTSIGGVASSTNQWSTSAAWLDYDNDGRLDLFVCNYVSWSPELDRKAMFTYDGATRAYGPPRNFKGAHPTLFRNEGSGRFADVSASSGIQVADPSGEPLAKALGVAPVDLDGDGWMDIIVANDTVQNLVFRNERNGSFREIGARSGIAFDTFGAARGAMGIDTARFRDDDALGVAIGNFANEMNAFYVAQNDPLHFADEATQAGLGPASQQFLKFGLFFFDYDLDGRLDVLTANGHLDPDIERFHLKQQYRQPAQLFWNRGGTRGGMFVDVGSIDARLDLFRPIVGRGSAYADIDGDGDLDLVMTQNAGRPVLLRNDQDLGHRWCRVKLVGTTSNREAIGAWMKLRVGGRVLARQVMPTKGYLSQSEIILTFGLGRHSRIDEAEVTWPGGRRQSVPNLQPNRLAVVRETP